MLIEFFHLSNLYKIKMKMSKHQYNSFLMNTAINLIKEYSIENKIDEIKIDSILKELKGVEVL